MPIQGNVAPAITTEDLIAVAHTRVFFGHQSVGMNMLNAIHLLGYAGMWVTGANAYDPEINASLGFEAPSRLVGFLAVGTPRATAAVERPSRADHVVEWDGSSRET